MSLYTTILSLFKYNLDTDGKNTYNIQLALNDNWDKIDAFAKSILEKVETVKGTITTKFNELNAAKTNLNLNNISKDGLQKIYSQLAINTNAGISVSSGWTADTNGWLYIYHKNSSDGQKLTVYINEKAVFYSGDSGTWSAGHATGGVAFIGKNQVLTFTGSGSNSITFYPCLAEN